jgi:hypothetical protein
MLAGKDWKDFQSCFNTILFSHDSMTVTNHIPLKNYNLPPKNDIWHQKMIFSAPKTTKHGLNFRAKNLLKRKQTKFLLEKRVPYFRA